MRPEPVEHPHLWAGHRTKVCGTEQWKIKSRERINDGAKVEKLQRPRSTDECVSPHQKDTPSTDRERKLLKMQGNR